MTTAMAAGSTSPPWPASSSPTRRTAPSSARPPAACAPPSPDTRPKRRRATLRGRRRGRPSAAPAEETPCPDPRDRPLAHLRVTTTPAPPVAGAVGIGGPGARAAGWSRALPDPREEMSLAVVANDIYTTEDTDFLRRGRRPARRADRRGQDRVLPAHRRSVTTSPPTSTRRGPGRAGPGSNSCSSSPAGQPHRLVQRRPRGRAGVRRRRRRQGQGAPQGRARRHQSDLLVVDKSSSRPWSGRAWVMADDAARCARAGRRCSCRCARTRPRPGRGLGPRGRGPGDGRRRGRPLRTGVEVVAEGAAGAAGRAAGSVGPSCAGCARTVRRSPSGGPRRRGPRRQDPGGARVHLVGTAAGPMGGDVVEVRLVVGPGAASTWPASPRLSCCPRAPSRCPGCCSTWTSPRAGRLVCDLPPAVVTGAGRAGATTRVRLAGGAARLGEHVRLGRHGEPGGSWRGRTAGHPGRRGRCCGSRRRSARTPTTGCASCAASSTPEASPRRGRRQASRSPRSTRGLRRPRPRRGRHPDGDARLSRGDGAWYR